MGIPPDYRVKVSFPFYHCGIDYAGPVLMKFFNGRGQRSFKGYIAVFICMTTRAVHLEAVSGLTTEAFMAELKRFFARRGRSAHLYSDNGTNFDGAARSIEKDFVQAVRQNANLTETLENHQVKWHFIPPASPHFGGLWEAAVKFMKYHLKRIIGETKMTYEEMSTLLAQIEAVLNSRPICSMNEDVEVLEVLTPGRFLIGRPLIEVPESINERNMGCMDRWKLIQKMKKHFWNSWTNDYLTTLQQRYKWKTSTKNLQEGQIVIIKNEETHPARWPLARITDVHPGKDGLVRAVTVKTASGSVIRPINKICPLDNVPPVQESPKVTRVNYTRVDKKTRVGISYIWVLLLMYIGCTKSDPIRIGASLKEIKNSVIIYLDHIGSMDVVSSKWNLLVYYDMEQFLWRY
ncbi:uncharacterized protein LOC131994772 [Stomoxys calcitrans]|uniref:uncharacterized protein LOC131994772 n=1 Tax=Stomoxys calcitrans TaxID=35570 RepID=UPI0027E2FD0F|nr:uncharacterized protein LOC131994772 [Stomoxys calcitrans]